MTVRRTSNAQRLICLVTGGAGFIGSNLAEVLIQEGHKVVIVDNLSTGKKENIPQKAMFFEIDITQRNKLEEVFAKIKPDTVFHLAAQASVNRSVEDPVLDVKVNVTGTINLLDLSRRYEVKNFIFSSTGGAIYGDDAPRPTPETANVNPLTPYGIDKFQAEKFIEFFSQNAPFKSIILRYANVYGPKQDPLGEAGVVAIFTVKMLSGEPVTIYGDGEQTRDFVYVGDVVKANLNALGLKSDGTFNIGSGVEKSVNEVAQILKVTTGSKSEIIHGDPKIEQRHSLLDNRKATLELDWKPEVALEEGLKKTVDYFKK